MKLTRRKFLVGVSALPLVRYLVPTLPASAVWTPIRAATHLDVEVNEVGGVVDSSFLGNTYVGCYVRANILEGTVTPPWKAASADPQSTPWGRGDIVWNTTPNDGTLGWMCTKAGDA